MHLISILCSLLSFLVLTFPRHVQSMCCRLPFTDGRCQVNTNGPHRYQTMPDRRSGPVLESTECYINDFNSNYRQLLKVNNDCNECPGLLILHTNSSEIFLFPEYLERILEGRTQIQRKNVVILTTSLIGAYDLDFTFLARYYNGRSIDDVPSLYIDLQLPPYDSKQGPQSKLFLRVPQYYENDEGPLTIDRRELMNPSNSGGQMMKTFHQLPHLYHFDMKLHRQQPNFCTIYEIQVTSSSLVWKPLNLTFSNSCVPLSSFGRNKCFATGFARLFCAIEENIFSHERLKPLSYIQTNSYVEHLTVAITGGRHVSMSLSNSQLKPAEHIKILVLKGQLKLTDANKNLTIQLEYGWNCKEFKITISNEYSITRYYPFNGEQLVVNLKTHAVYLPKCFEIVPSESQKSSPIETYNHSYSVIESHLDTEQSTLLEIDSINDVQFTNTSTGHAQMFVNDYWKNLSDDSSLTYAAIVGLVLFSLIPLCFMVCYCTYCNRYRKSSWTLKHDGHTNDAYQSSETGQCSISALAYMNKSVQTTDDYVRI